MPAVAERARRRGRRRRERSSASSAAPGPGASRACASPARSRRGSRSRRCARWSPSRRSRWSSRRGTPLAPGRYLAALDAMRGEHYVALFEVGATGAMRALGPERASLSTRRRSRAARRRRAPSRSGPVAQVRRTSSRTRAAPPGSTDLDRRDAGCRSGGVGARLRPAGRGAGEVGGDARTAARGRMTRAGLETAAHPSARCGPISPAIAARSSGRRSPIPGPWTRSRRARRWTGCGCWSPSPPGADGGDAAPDCCGYVVALVVGRRGGDRRTSRSRPRRGGGDRRARCSTRCWPSSASARRADRVSRGAGVERGGARAVRIARASRRSGGGAGTTGSPVEDALVLRREIGPAEVKCHVKRWRSAL